MADFLNAAVHLDPGTHLPWLADLNRKGLKTCMGQTLPTRKTEAWKYTSLRRLERGEYLSAPATLSADELAEPSLRVYYEIDELDACTLVFVNGHFSRGLSASRIPEGAELIRFADANATEATLIKQYLGTVANTEQHLFASLNDGWLADGIFLRVGKNVKIDQAFQIVWLSLPQSEPFSLSQRLLVVMEEGSEATVVEHFCSDATQQNCFTNGVTELVLNANSRLHHYRLQLEEESAIHIGGVHASLERDAVLDSFHLGMGSILKRVDVVVNHVGEGAHCELSGIYLPRNHQHVDYHTCIEHIAPRCTTTENFRGIIADEARAVFNGRIHIHPDAQKTAATLSNRNLLTSDKAEVDTKPELEIYADDVQCAHGATVAQLEEQSMYYLMTRGISEQEAKVMLSFGFINELVNKLSHEAVRNYLRPSLAALFARDSRLNRHIV